MKTNQSFGDRQEKKLSDSTGFEDAQLPDLLDAQPTCPIFLLHNSIPQHTLDTAEFKIYNLETERLVPRKQTQYELLIQKKENEENKREIKGGPPLNEVKEFAKNTDRKSHPTDEAKKKPQKSEPRTFLLISDSICKGPPCAVLITQKLSNMGIHFDSDDIASTKSVVNGLTFGSFIAIFSFKNLDKGNECAAQLQSEPLMKQQFAKISRRRRYQEILMNIEHPGCSTFSFFFLECLRQIQHTLQDVIGLVKGDRESMERLLAMIGKHNAQEVLRGFSKKGQRDIIYAYRKIFGTKDISFWIA